VKISNNKLSSVKTFFLKELETFEEAKLYFEICCDAWLGMTKTDLLIDKEKELSESEILKFFYGIKSLKKNEPVQYVVGETWFYDLKIGVEEGVLIPRPETEELVDWIINSESNARSILDIGTGSGCIPLALKNNIVKAKVSACDISDSAIIIATKNAELLKLDVNFFHKDILDDTSWDEDKLDVIVSNPPYIPEKEKGRMNENVLEYEPDLALFVPNDSPLLFYIKIAEFSKLHLNKKGCLFFEIHEDFGQETIDMLSNKGFVDIELKQDLQGKDRMIKAVSA
jgi:release factor glutamine methyltransferase